MINFNIKLPVEYDYTIYSSFAGNFDISFLEEEKAWQHYCEFGLEEGRVCSEICRRQDFINLIPKQEDILEIGPFFSPAFNPQEAKVYYLDCISTTEMIQRAKNIDGASIEKIPNIDYLWSGQKYTDLVRRKFSIIYSSHNLEHQPDLVAHLKNLESILTENGAVFLIIPDKRYCFDHYFPETSFNDVADAWKTNLGRHRLKDILDHQFFATHNDPVRHWRGDHGINKTTRHLEERLQSQYFQEIEKYCSNSDKVDVHAWKFTPENFRVIFEDLYRLKIINLRILRVYPTLKNSNEFYAVLAP